MEKRILLTGAGGFIGGAVARELVRRGWAGQVRAVTHRRPPATPGTRLTCVQADLADPDSLRGLCDGIDTVVHAAVLIGGDEDACEAVNHRGTAELMRQAREAGVRRVLHVSTAAVHGDGPHLRVTEDQRPVPVSPTSRTRLAAEGEVLAAGGTVLRPMYIMGAGDVWFLPSLWQLTRYLDAWIDGGEALLSCTTVDQLAAVLADVATGERDLEPGTVYHADHPEPARVRDLMIALAESLGQPLPPAAARVSRAEALALLPDGIGAQALRLFGETRWFDTTRLWSALGANPGPGPAPASLVASYRDWYLPQLTGEAA
ncbi:NAD-dependent epimerase/dehydratase family protein [Parafrankia sp. FMc2]|uniref:NAD-dependent epimerase/dehydratase family protein n=1 Tax=Parafrankia sp. FMc2 TaxID=3233196 RepID=UPI0034D3B61D